MAKTKQVTNELIRTEDFTSAKIDTSFWIDVVSELNADVSAKCFSTHHEQLGVSEMLDLITNYCVS
jgi:hypothetical protein